MSKRTSFVLIVFIFEVFLFGIVLIDANTSRIKEEKAIVQNNNNFMNH